MQKLVQTLLLSSRLCGKLDTKNDILNLAKERGVRANRCVRHVFRTKGLGHLLLNGQWQSLVVFTEEVHAWNIMPWFVQDFVGEDSRRAVLQLGNCDFLSLTIDVVVENDFGRCCMAIFSL